MVKLFSLSKWTWKLVVVIGVVIGVITGSLTIYDRLLSAVPEEGIEEYVFGSQYYWVQALVDETNKVVAFGVTTRDKDFQPKFTILKGLYYITDKVNPSDRSKWVSGEKNIVLGKTTFAGLNEVPDDIEPLSSFHDFYYHEEYYFGNAALYQSIFLAVNNSGYYEYEFDPFNIIKYRAAEPINTFYITAPYIGLGESSIRKYLVGVDNNQVRTLPASTVRKNKSLAQQLKDVESLASSATLKSFKETLGDPLIVNNRPTNPIRSDVTVQQRWNANHKSFLIKICKIDYLFRLPFLKSLCVDQFLDWLGKYESGNLPSNTAFVEP